MGFAGAAAQRACYKRMRNVSHPPYRLEERGENSVKNT